MEQYQNQEQHPNEIIFERDKDKRLMPEQIQESEDGKPQIYILRTLDRSGIEPELNDFYVVVREIQHGEKSHYVGGRLYTPDFSETYKFGSQLTHDGFVISEKDADKLDNLFDRPEPTGYFLSELPGTEKQDPELRYSLDQPLETVTG